MHNYGEDGHDLAVRNRSGRVLGTLPEIGPGRTDTLRVRLRRPGRYVVFCSLEGHEERGCGRCCGWCGGGGSRRRRRRTAAG